ncbi:hypothetical protein [Streptacidiphilus sp. P02-A3a]|uniref:hypothetical protein n=1 Tax=Streptacidiphilus sp. P02-A3a TaxID=2704468 RepID=UPI0015FC03A2|nr:hypothetical protein [Streptacidiphilus sp. P02-A3a]QMU69765.1 hypothetical protein GXP74_17500 [Streptacidiphilus sp. P02-A3a]
MAVRFLSQEWLDERVRRSAALQPTPDASLVLQHVVTQGPDGVVEFFDELRDGLLVHSGLGRHQDADLTVINSWQDELRLMRGEIDPFNMIADGTIRLEGDQGALFKLLTVIKSQMIAVAIVARGLVDLVDLPVETG